MRRVDGVGKERAQTNPPTYSTTGSEWKTIQTWGFEENSGVVGFNEDGSGVYVVSSLGSDTTRLVELDAGDGKERRTLVADPRCDVGEVMVDEETHAPQAVSLNYERSDWRVLDKGVEKDFAAIKAAVEKEGEGEEREFRVLSRGEKDGVWVVAVSGDAVPTAYYLYYRATQVGRVCGWMGG